MLSASRLADRHDVPRDTRIGILSPFTVSALISIDAAGVSAHEFIDILLVEQQLQTLVIDHGLSIPHLRRLDIRVNGAAVATS